MLERSCRGAVRVEKEGNQINKHYRKEKEKQEKKTSETRKSKSDK